MIQTIRINTPACRARPGWCSPTGGSCPRKPRGGVLPGAFAFARGIDRGAGEALRDLHPLLRSLADDFEPGIEDVTALRDDLAKIDRASFDPVVRIRRVPLPDSAGWSVKADVRLDRRRLQAAIAEREPEGAN